MATIDPSYYNVNESTDALIEKLVEKFAQSESFEALLDSGAVDNVTPAQWKSQLEEATKALREQLNNALHDVHVSLHTGNFHLTRPFKCQCGCK